MNYQKGPGSTLLGLVRTAGDLDTAWMKEAKCRGMDPEIFFPAPGTLALEAKLTCSECPVKVQCLQYRLASTPGNGPYGDGGIWGGTNGNDRKRLRGWSRQRNSQDISDKSA